MGEVGEYAGLLLEHRAGTARVALGDEMLHVAHYLHGRVQARLVVLVHGVQRPGLDGLLIHGIETGNGAGDELVGDVDIGTGHAAHQLQDETLLRPRQRGNHLRRRLRVDKGKLHLQPRIESRLNGILIESFHYLSLPLLPGSRRPAGVEGQGEGIRFSALTILNWCCRSAAPGAMGTSFKQTIHVHVAKMPDYRDPAPRVYPLSPGTTVPRRGRGLG